MRSVWMLAGLWLALPLCAQDDLGSFDEELARYREYAQRPSLYVRVLGIERFVQTADARALELLLQRYLKPEDPGEHVAHLIAGILGESFLEPEYLEVFTKPGSKLRKEQHTWLWFQIYWIQASCAEQQQVCDAVGDRKLPGTLRAAALQALSDLGEAEAVLSCIEGLLGPGFAREKGRDRTVLAEACAAGLLGAAESWGQPAFDAALSLVIDLLDDSRTSMRSKIVIARQLGILLESPQLYLSGDPWRALLAEEDSGAEGGTRVAGLEEGVTVPQFLGIEGVGRRIAYVIDMSDSMLEPLTEAEKDALRRPVTGASGAGVGLEMIESLPWDRIHNRFDAAREALKFSLQQLGPNMEFAVFFFGSEAHPLLGSGGLVAASERNRAAAIKALDAVVPGPPAENRPHGTLRGYTNLHGGLLDAFRAVSKKALSGWEHIDAEAFEEGCDTIFLLSDGAPSWDDFPADDRAEPDIVVGDAEADVYERGSDEIVEYPGPYVELQHLYRDVWRMNLLRRVELHCIGIGEAEAGLLQDLAELGQGQYRSIGGESE